MENKELNNFTAKQLLSLYKLNAKKIWIKVVIATVVIALYSFIHPHTYESTTSIMPPKQSESSGLSGLLQGLSGAMPSGLSLPGMPSSNQSQILGEILRSRSIAEYIIDTLKLSQNEMFKGLTRNELIEALQEMMDVDILRSGLITITARAKTSFFPFSDDKDKAKRLAADIATKSTEGLDLTVRERSTSAARKSREYVERELANYRNKSDSIDNVLESFQRENKVLKIDDQTQELVKQAIEVGLQLAKAEMELNIAMSEYSKNHPIVEQLRAVVEQLRKQYHSVQSGGLTGSDGFSIPFDKIPSLARQYANIYRDKKVFEQVILYLETQRHQEAIQESRDIPVIEPLDKAYLPDKQSSPSKKMMVLLGFFLSFVIFSTYHIYKTVSTKYKEHTKE